MHSRWTFARRQADRLIPHPSFLIPLVPLLLLPGCGGGPETCPVSGTVTWNGQAVPEGNVIFAPEDGKGVEDAGLIKDGAYRFDAKPGKKKVKIHATRPSGKVDPLMGMAPREEYIPREYNVDTKLRAEVKPGDKNEFNFPLQGPEAKKP